MYMNKIIISENANPELISWLTDSGFSIQKVPCFNNSPIGTHADLYYCQIKTGLVFSGDTTKVGSEYPSDCIYNAACTGRFFIHNTKITDPSILNMAKEYKMDIIHVKQGYAKCSCVIVDENSIITSDAGIAKACQDKLDCLLIEPGHVLLEGFQYGFLGGASGRIDDTIIFNGDISAHPDWPHIKEFITTRKLHIKCFNAYPLTDIGSIICCNRLQTAFE